MPAAGTHWPRYTCDACGQLKTVRQFDADENNDRNTVCRTCMAATVGGGAMRRADRALAEMAEARDTPRISRRYPAIEAVWSHLPKHGQWTEEQRKAFFRALSAAIDLEIAVAGAA